MGWTYSKAGVDIEKESDAIKALAERLKLTFENRPGKVMGKIGYFANMIDMGEKALVLCMDGVGSKVLLAQKLDKYDTVGIDLIAMNANDAICNGAEPIALVDYLAVVEPNPEILSEIGKGLVKGAKQAGIAIIGGETATLPQVIKGEGKKAFDLAGTCLAVVDKNDIITGEEIEEGDTLIGLPSSGLHSNGFSLARKVLDMEDGAILEELLTPTKIYVKPVLKLAKKVKIKGLAHMTGGGLLNLLRLNSKIGFEITDWPHVKEIFLKIQEAGQISDEEMYKTFNMGIGFCVVVQPAMVNRAMEILKAEKPVVLGKAIKGHKIIFNDMEFKE